MKSAAILVFVALALVASTAAARSFDPRAWRGEQAGRPTEMLTLGTAHLALIEKPVTASMLAPLVDRLAAWKPDVITIESISGEQCDVLDRYRTRYPGMWDAYCWGTAEAQKATGLSVAQAMAAAEAALRDWPASPDAAQRRRLAVLFLAAGDRFSAQVQWLTLPVEQRIASAEIDASLLPILNRVGRKPNESYDIGVTLAVRLGLQRVYSVDDHTADSIQALAPSGFDAAMNRIWSQPRIGALAEFETRSNALANPADLLDFYRFLNAPATGRALTDADHRAAMRDQAPSFPGRQYLAWWETRNLRMVANIRAAAGNRPGARVLNIVGAAHKPFYDAYLSMLPDIVVRDVRTVLE